jgi:hypothetical protein
MTNSVYLGEVSGNGSEKESNNNSELYKCKSGKGIYKYSNNDVYMGDWCNDTFNGLGMLIFRNGDVYRGFLKNGKELKGKYNYANGDVYEGDFKNGCQHGYGEMKIKGKVSSHNQSLDEGLF